jgi:AmmeMemoRadiSam system protein B
MNLVREPQVAGMFYPASSTKLQKQITDFLSEVELDIEISNVAGIIAPHAGYVYSGKTAASAYKTIMNKDYNTVIVISPSHREYFRKVSIYDGDAYKTPLGEISIATELREKLITENDLIFEGEEGHRAEHALEVQLPFLQIALHNFNLLPLVIGDQSREVVFELADILSNVIDDKTLLVASSDLSHFYTKSQASALDLRVVKHINNFDYENLQTDLETKRCEACGGGGIVTILKALNLKGYTKSKVVAHSDSGDVTSDDSEVVGYLSAIIYN